VKILLDECLPVDLRHRFSVHEVHTAEWARLKGAKNGELLDAAKIAGYDVLITIDQGFAHQQNLGGRKIGPLILVAPSNQIEDLALLVPAALAALNAVQPGSVVRFEER
jgi:predicted nuclease of predicted toxin-antitoxin system